MSKLFYLATPYTGHRDGKAMAYQDALYAASSLIDLGLEVFSPVVHFHPLSRLMKPKPHSFWMARCMPWLMRCDELLVVQMPGWQDSKGIAEEVALFESIHRPPVYLSWPLTDDQICIVLARDSAALSPPDIRRASFAD